jgi:predicted ATPase/class 3 adenylate cyclase
MEPRTRPPTGTVTFLFTDIEGSATRWDAHRAEMQEAIRRHDELMRAAIERNGGYVFKTIGDAFCAAFATVPEAVTAALDAQRAVGAADWNTIGGLRARMAIHAGVADERDADYFGPTVNRVARLLAIGHGGQVLLSRAAKELSGELLPAQAELLDLGRHRLRDLSAPEHVFQLHTPDLPQEFPALHSLDVLPNNLPAHLTPLIGRDEEIAQIQALLERSRLVTLTGTGGIGKTRTAIQVAADMLHSDGDGVWFVDLAPLDDPTLVPSAIAQVFNVTDEGGSRPLIERIAAALKAKTLLIVLDNCEHVISAAADAADRLLQVCSGVRILATSREPLGIAGEESYRMPTLPVPPDGEKMTAESATQYAAAALFVARAHAAQRTFALTDENAEIVADIVRRLDGIALAIELAAPRVKMLSLNRLDQRLDERFKLLTGGSRTALPRQQTLRATIDWSYDLLTPAEQSMLRQLAIFRGGWALEAAEAICVDERLADWDALDLLSALVDKSLVVVEIEGTEQRYRLLESTRQFAAERLDKAGEREDVAARHCRYLAREAQRAGDAYWQTDSDQWTAQVRADLENYRSAIDWGLMGAGDTEAAAAIVAGLGSLWAKIARREGRTLLEKVATALAGDAPAPVRGRLTLAEARLHEFSAKAALAAAEAARLMSAVDQVGYVEALFFEGVALARTGRHAESVVIFEKALAAARAIRIPRLTARVLSMASIVFAGDDRARALPFVDEGAALLGACNDRQRLAILQLNRAELLFAEGEVVGALAAAREAEPIFRKSGAGMNLSSALQNAAAYLLALARFDEAWAAAKESLELALRADVADYFANAIGHLAHLAAETGDPARAARLLGYSDTVYRKIGDVRELTEQRGYDRALELIRAALSDDRIRALMAEGAAMEQDAAVAEAMAIPRPPAIRERPKTAEETKPEQSAKALRLR